MLEPQPSIILLWGAPAAGKSTLASSIARLYSDKFGVELCHLGTDRLSQAILGDSFDADIRDSLYASLMELSSQFLKKNRSILVEGTFLEPRWRRELEAVAGLYAVPLLSVQIECRLALREQRNRGRAEAELVPEGFLRNSHERAKNQLGDADFVFDTELLDSQRLARYLFGEMERLSRPGCTID